MGFGNSATCNQGQAPCSLTTQGSSPGCNIPCGSTQVNDGKTSSYLLSNPSLTWVATDSVNMLKVNNPLRILGPFNFYFGRIQVDGVNVLGKVQAAKGVFEFQAVTASGAIKATSGFEILTCSIPNGCCEFNE